MTDDLRLNEMREAVRRLNEAADAYYNGRAEVMSDFEWDALFDRVRSLESATGVILEDSPTNRVSADDAPGSKEAHEFAALSLAKTKSVGEVAAWAEGRPIWLSWKLDGLTLVVTYDGGRLTKVVTRGDGHTGTNITRLAGAIRGIPQRVADAGHLVVRGEAVIAYDDFNAFVESSEDDYANPRNLAAGSLTLKNVEELRERKLQWLAFTLVHADREIVSWGGRLDYLDSLGFTTVDRERIDSPTQVNLESAIERWTVRVTSRENPFPVDGLVVAYDDTVYAATGSVTGHHATRAGFAFKWQDESAASTLERIEWSCAVRAISPVAVFSPVALEGTVVRRASLCNVSECERLGIGGAGSEISVIKANKIIPKVIAVTRTAGTFEIPSACPVCGAPTRVAVSPSGAKTLHCTSDGCPAKKLAEFERFVAKGGLDIDGLAGETIAKFIACGWLKTRADVYRLGAHHGEIAALDGFGAKSADNIVSSIENARVRDAAHFLVALSIPNCGVDVARRLTAAYPLAELFEIAARGERESFAALDGIGPVKSSSFVDWYANAANRALVADLLGEVRVTDCNGARTGGRCAGLTFVVTGSLETYANRDELKSYVEAEGGKVAGSVSAKTSYLVNNDVTSTSGKNRKARELSIPIISELQFREMFGG